MPSAKTDPEPEAPAGTRGLILATALRMFRGRGYDETTMRAIAGEAGVSVGNAYYYFRSKEHLIQAFYVQLNTEHVASVRAVLATERDLTARLVAALRQWVTVAAPYHAFAGKFFKIAAEPTSPLSPFSAQSGPARETALGLYREVVDGSDARIAKDLRAELPHLLWLYQMGVVLYWVHDRSPGTANTVRLIDRTVPMVTRLVGVARLPVMRATVRDVVELVRELGPKVG